MQETILSVLKSARQQLQSAEVSNYENEALWILCHVLGCSTEQFYMGHHSLTFEQLREYRRLIGERVIRKPIQYILGTEYFMDLELIVRPGALIPRPETEMLVEKVLEIAKKNPTLSVLDLCTGTGAIGLAVARHAPFAKVTCTDISADALCVARENTDLLGLTERVELVEGDLFAPLEGRTFDVIVSNPPYIPTRDIEELQPEVRDYEPKTALDGGEDGLDFYRTIVECAPDYLEHRGVLIFEAGIHQCESIALMMQENFSDVRIYEDFSGIQRMITGRVG